MRLTLIMMGALVAACAAPPPRAADLADRERLDRQLVQGSNFTHVVYRRRGALPRGPLHVYLEGDGSPWVGRSRVAIDPTARNPVALRMMLQDPASSIYLGRPCYEGQAFDPRCSPQLWTSGRYSPEVVGSMAAALRHVLDETPNDGVVFIGYSGGGTLAMLLAERFLPTRAVITVAGNLDTAGWVAWHRYSPLDGSLDPATRAPLPATVAQLHLVGGRDKNVPTLLAKRVVSRQRCARVIIFENFDHVCCWDATWSRILHELEAVLTRSDGWGTANSECIVPNSGALLRWNLERGKRSESRNPAAPNSMGSLEW